MLLLWLAGCRNLFDLFLAGCVLRVIMSESKPHVVGVEVIKQNGINVDELNYRTVNMMFWNKLINPFRADRVIVNFVG